MGASQFEQSAGSLKRKMAWQNMKMMILMGVVGTIMAAVVICKSYFFHFRIDINKCLIQILTPI